MKNLLGAALVLLFFMCDCRAQSRPPSPVTNIKYGDRTINVALVYAIDVTTDKVTVYFGPKPQKPVVLPHIPAAIEKFLDELKNVFAQVYDLGQHQLISQFLSLAKLPPIGICQEIIKDRVSGNVWVAYGTDGNPVAAFTYPEDRVASELAVCSG